MAAGKITVNKTFHKIKGEDVITKPKTEKSIRDIYIPEFLVECLQAYIKRIYKADSDTRLFSMAHSSYGKKLNNKAAIAGVKRIRVHDLRHSHASLLIELGFSALLISERLGHESVTTTLNIYAHLFPSSKVKLSTNCKNYMHQKNNSTELVPEYKKRAETLDKQVFSALLWR